MLFNSFIFIFIFMPITFFIYFYLHKKNLTRVSKVFLILASLFFYSWWNILYLPVIVSSMLFNYSVGISLTNGNLGQFKKKLLLTIGITANVSLLVYFKYVDFLIENINLVVNKNYDLLNLTLPLAISFFTFQQIAYLVDSYKGEIAEYSLLNYASFVTFFPQLIAGPIVHHAEMMPQFTKNKNKNYTNIALGSFIFTIGLFKKVVIADTFAIWATHGFDVAKTLNFFEAWGTSLSYTFQLYFDFSGYTDMAIGIALLFNIRLPINFNSPYKATNIQDFWRRWHITLSRFLRDYVYIPLGGNKEGSIKTYVNLMATFILGGIWHGAAWTFVFWGILHGLAIVIQKIWSLFGIKIWSWMAWIITFNFINITWVFFRAEEWIDAMKVIRGMLNVENIIISKSFSKLWNDLFPVFLNINGVELKTFINVYMFAMIILGFGIILLFPNSNVLGRKFDSFVEVPLYWYVFSVVILGISFIVMSAQTGSTFLYFNF